MSPREASMSIKAAKSRQDDHYGQMASWVALIANASGNLKKPVKARDLYETQLVSPKAARRRKSRAEVAEENAEAMRIMEEAMEGRQ